MPRTDAAQEERAAPLKTRPLGRRPPRARVRAEARAPTPLCQHAMSVPAPSMAARTATAGSGAVAGTGARAAAPVAAPDTAAVRELPGQAVAALPTLLGHSRNQKQQLDGARH